MSSEAVYLVQALTTVAAFGAAMWAFAWALRKLSVGGRLGGPLELLARLSLDGRRSIALVRVGARVIIVGIGDGPLTRLGTMPLTEYEREVRPTTLPTTTFASVLARMRSRPTATPSAAIQAETAPSMNGRGVASDSLSDAPTSPRD